MTINKRFKIRMRSGLVTAVLVTVAVTLAASVPAPPAVAAFEPPPMHFKGGSGLTFQIDVVGSAAVTDLPIIGPIVIDPGAAPPLVELELGQDVLCMQNGAQSGVTVELTDTNGRMTAYDGFAGISYFPTAMAPVDGMTLKIQTDNNPKCALVPPIAKSAIMSGTPVECALSDILFGDGFETGGGGTSASGPNLQVDFRLIQHPNITTNAPAIYNIHVTNCGDAAASTVAVRDIFPTSMAPAPKFVAFQPWQCVGAPSCNGAGYISQVFSQIAPGGSRVIQATRALEPGAVAGQMIRISAAAVSLSNTPDAQPTFNSGTWEVEIRDNEAPTVSVTGTADSLAEDDGTVAVSGVTIGASDADGTIASVAVSSLNPSILTIDSVDDTDPGNVLVNVTTVADAFGTATLQVVATDDLGGTSIPVTFPVTVDSINDPPTVTVKGGFNYNGGTPTFSGNCTQASAPGCADQDYPSDVGQFPASFLNWVVQISPGPANESGQTPTVGIGAPSDPNLFISALFQPKLTVNGSSWNLDYGLSGASGTATLVITVDDGEAANNITTLSFDIFVDNAPPMVSVTGIPDNLAEDAGTVPVTGVTIAATDVDGTIAAVAVTSLSTSILTIDSVDDTDPANVAVTVDTVADEFGTATLEVIATDDVGNESPPVTFDVVVDPVNDPPTITVLGGFDYNGGAPLFAGPNCTDASAAGCADQDFPSDVGALSVDFEGWVVQFSPGPANESGQITTVSIGAPSDPTLFINPTFEPRVTGSGGTRDLVYGLSGTSGTATLVVAVDDGEASNNLTMLSFDIVVADPP